MVILSEMTVNKNIVELYTLTLQCLQYKIMNRPERLFRERVCTETILIADHHKLEIEILADEREITEHSFNKHKFLKCINLLISRLFDYCAVSIY